jgi:hypothetical protein
MSCLGSIGPISLGDCGPKSSLNIKTTSSVTNNLTEELKTLQSQKASTVILQDQDVTALNKSRCCFPLKVSQGLTAVIVDTSKITAQFKSETANKITTDIQNSLDQASKVTSGVLATPAGSNLKTAIENALTTMNNTGKIASIVGEKVSNVLAKQNQKVLIDCGTSPLAAEITPRPPAEANMPDQGCYIDQNFVFQQTANNIMESVFNSISNNVDVKKAIAEVKQTQETESKGLDTITGQAAGVAKSFIAGGTMIYIAIIAAIVLFIPLIIWAFKSGGSSSSPAPVEATIAQFLRKASRRR